MYHIIYYIYHIIHHLMHIYNCIIVYLSGTVYYVSHQYITYTAYSILYQPNKDTV